MIPAKQQFIHFLKQNNIYETFVFYFNKREDIRNNICPKSRFFSETEHIKYIDKAFSWSSTKEGHMFWFRMSTNWRRYYSNLIKAMQYEFEF